MLRAFTLPVRLLLPLLAIGCEVAAVDSVAPSVTVNSCREDEASDCTKGIATCQSGRCVAIKGSFSTILLDISVPASGTASSGLSYLWREDNLNLTGENWDIKLAPVADVLGRVTATPYVDPESGEPCSLEFVGETSNVPAAQNGSIPVDVVFSPADRVLGIESPGYTAKVDTSIAEQFGNAPDSFDFQVNLPQGEYDIYVKPRAGPKGSCQLPPALIRRQRATSDDVGVGVTLPAPSRFDLTLSWPSSASQPPPEGWTVDMLDPISGRLVSTRAKLSASKMSGELEAVIYYIPPDPLLPPDKSELLRLMPPEGVTAPTVVLARSALELFTKGSGLIKQFQGYPDAVRVQGQVTTSDAAPAGATVTLTAKSIEGVDQGVFTSFVRTVEVGAEGTFEVELLPGTYRVLAVPTSPTAGTGERSSAATESEWTVAAQPMTQAGKIVELDPIVKVSGTAYAPQGSEPALGAVVTAVASPRSMQKDLLTLAAEGNTPFAPSAESGVVGENGSFTVRADPGDFDVSLRPPASSGFSWFVTHYPVRQHLNEPATFGVLVMPYPVPYTGRVSVVDAKGADKGTGSVQGLSQALIRAYIYLDQDGSYIDDPTRAASVLQIGETRADRDGQFELLIPANLN